MHDLKKGTLPKTRCNSKFSTSKLNVLLSAHSFTVQETTYKVIKHSQGITIEMHALLKIHIEKITSLLYNKDSVLFKKEEDGEYWELHINFESPEQPRLAEKVWSCILCQLAYNLEEDFHKKKTRKIERKNGKQVLSACS